MSENTPTSPSGVKTVRNSLWRFTRVVIAYSMAGYSLMPFCKMAVMSSLVLMLYVQGTAEKWWSKYYFRGQACWSMI